MHTGRTRFLAGLAAVVLGSIPAGAQTPAAAATTDPEGAEVLTRGPVHEAFAGAVTYNPEPGIIIASKPPEAIDEIPPDQKPVGDNVAWIPGYWAWDEDQKDFLWISGVWRNLPPGREWVPGYWASLDARYQWTSGYWQDAEASTVEYLPEPPKSLETGPNIESPGEDYNWVPGNWMYADNSYAWRAGYWAAARENWVWTPACYRWTHRGYVYVDGYWDYGVANRGVLFAPVHFSSSYYSNPGYYYTPSTVIGLSVFVDHLFLRPNYCHYYFGDYYAPRYRGYGYYPSYFYHGSRRGCDPIYGYYRWQNRHDHHWERGRREYFEYRRDHEDSRPPRTWTAFQSRPDRDRNFMAQRYDRFVGGRGDGRQEFRSMDRQDRDRLVSQRQEMRQYGRDRQEREARGNRQEGQAAQVSRSEIRRSPLVARRSDRPQDTPPRRLEENRGGQGRQVMRAADRPAIASRPARPQDARPGQAGTANRQLVPAPGRSEYQRGQSTSPGRTTRTEPGRQGAVQNRSAVPAPGRDTIRRSDGGTQNARVVPAPARQRQDTARREATPQRVTPPRPATQVPRQNTARPQQQQAPARRAVPAPQQRQQIQRTQPQRQQIQRAQPQQRQQIQRVQPQRQQIQRPQPQRQQIQRSQPQPQRQQMQRPQPQRQQIQRAQPQRSQPRMQQQQRPSQRQSQTAPGRDSGKNRRIV